MNGYRVTHICDLALAGNEQLTSVVIPEGVKGIGAYVFQDCTALTSVSIAESVTDIGDGIFDGCENLSIITVVPGSKAEIWCNANDYECEYEEVEEE